MKMPATENPNLDIILVSKKEYDDLVKDRIMLSCLQDVGVDNWTGYDDAMAEFRREYPAD